MRTMRDFHCSGCGTDTERFIDVKTTHVECSSCHQDAEQRIGMPTVKLEGITGDFPGAHHKWAKIREDNARIKGRRL